MITSKENKIVKEILSLKQKKNRDEIKKFIVEGPKFIHGLNVDKLIVSQSYAEQNEIAEAIVFSDSLFDFVSDVENPQGIMAICFQNNFSLSDLKIKTGDLYLLIDKVNDPGNLGSIIRTCKACAVDAVVLSCDSVDLYNPKVLRASAGNFANLKIIRAELSDAIHTLREHGVKIYATHLNSHMPHYKVDYKMKSSAIIIGNEANGVSENIIALADETIKIPMEMCVESLNISVACGIVLYEAYLQKLGR